MRSANLHYLADLYLEGDSVNPTDKEISTLVNWIRAEFSHLPCHVLFVAQDLNLPETISYFNQTGTLKISTLNSNHPFICAADNAKFRAIHDWHHIVGNCDSTLSGEIAAYKIARKSAPRKIWWLLHSEIVLQAAACIYMGEFQAQKFINAIGGGF